MSDPAKANTPWRRRDFRIAWAAGLVSNTGDWALAVGLPVYVFIETDSGTATAILFGIQLAVAGLLGPYAGGLVDRWDLRRCLVATNLAQAGLLLPLLFAGPDKIWPAYVAMAAQAALTQLNDPAAIALLPRLVDRCELPSANAALAASENLARLAGAPLGGLAVAWGGLGTIVAIDAASYMVAAVALARIASDTSPVPSPEPTSRGLRGGIAAVRHHRQLAAILALQGSAQIAQGAFVVLFVVFAVDALGDDGPGLGLLRGTMAVGAVAGAALVARMSDRIQPTTLFATGLLGMGCVSLVFWNAPLFTTALWVYLLLFSMAGLPAAALGVGLFTAVQTSTPVHMLGRAVGLMGALEAIGAAAGAIAAGLLVDRLPLRVLLDAQAGVYLLAGVAAIGLLVPHSIQIRSRRT